MARTGLSDVRRAMYVVGGIGTVLLAISFVVLVVCLLVDLVYYSNGSALISTSQNHIVDTIVIASGFAFVASLTLAYLGGKIIGGSFAESVAFAFVILVSLSVAILSVALYLDNAFIGEGIALSTSSTFAIVGAALTLGRSGVQRLTGWILALIAVILFFSVGSVYEVGLVGSFGLVSDLAMTGLLLAIIARMVAMSVETSSRSLPSLRTLTAVGALLFGTAFANGGFNFGWEIISEVTNKTLSISSSSSLALAWTVALGLVMLGSAGVLIMIASILGIAHLGIDQAGPGPLPPSTTGETLQAQPSSAATSIQTCTNCGMRLSGGEEYCSHCGQRVDVRASSKPSLS